MYFVNYDPDLLDSVGRGSNNEITDLGSQVDTYKFDLVGANSFEETNEVSRENGTSFWTQTGTLSLKKQDAATQKELKLLSYGRPHVLLEDYNGIIRLAGAENGADVQVGTATGAALGDANGYNITFTATEKSLADFVDSALVGASADFNVNSSQIDPDA